MSSFIGCSSSFAEAEIVLFGAPYDSTTSYRPGTRFGPSALRSESFGIETYSMRLDRDLERDVRVHDAGDLELPFGDQVRALDQIERQTETILAAGKLPFLFGGEHLVTLGAVRAAVRRFPDLRIVHFDAHADLRTDYLGNPLSHACVLRRSHELLGDGRIWQFGIRSGTADERAFMRAGHVTTELLGDSTLEAACAAIGGNVPVYLTVDLDVLDPAEFPGTGTPEAGGFAYGRLVDDLERVMSALNVVALDNVELAPQLDPSGRSTALACKLCREELLMLKGMK